MYTISDDQVQLSYDTNELWKGDLKSSGIEWTNLPVSTTNGPWNRTETSMTLYQDTLVVFGGILFQQNKEYALDNDELWSYNITTGNWGKLQAYAYVDAPVGTHFSPGRRYSHQAEIVECT